MSFLQISTLSMKGFLNVAVEEMSKKGDGS
jgi:hypothetical protein